MAEQQKPEQPQSGAIRMMAFGVFEEEHRSPLQVSFDEEPSPSLEHERLVMEEIKAHGWTLMKEVRGRGYTSRILLGPLTNAGKSWKTRPVIGRGTLQQCCRGAVNYLDRGAVVQASHITGIAPKGE